MIEDIKKLGKEVVNYSSLNLIKKMKTKKKSDDLYVLGSGSSINEIKNWDAVGKGDSIGFNFWMLHDFVPDYYFLEAPRDDYNLGVMQKVLLDKKDFYKNVFLVVKQRARSEIIEKTLKEAGLTFFKKRFHSFGAGCKEDLLKCIIQYKRSRVNDIFIHSQGVASVELIVVVGWLMGYKTITLCGVDLNNTNYFYESPSFKNVEVLPRPFQNGLIHKTNDPDMCYGRMPVAEVLKIYQEELLVDDCKIYIESSRSILADHFPLRSLS